MNSTAVISLPQALLALLVRPVRRCGQKKARQILATAVHCAFNAAVNETALRELQEADRSFHLHPFTNHLEMHGQGTQVIVSADGCYLTDATGQRLLNGLPGHWGVSVGYGRRDLLVAL